LGKAVPKGIKSKALLLLKEFPDKFSTDFEKNKLVLEEFGHGLFSKTNRNLIAGFIARKVVQQEKREKAKAAAKKLEEKKAEKAEPKAEKEEKK
jgi:ribosomal protein S17E